MGSTCVSNLCSNDVAFEQIDMKIPKRNVLTLEKYGKGAIARRSVQKMKLNSIKEIAELKTPMYPEDGREEIFYTDQNLISPEELEQFMNTEGKNLKWINSFQVITDRYYSMSKQNEEFLNKEKPQKLYKGQWKLQGLGQVSAADKKLQEKDLEASQKIEYNLNEQCVWEGIGIIQFADGSTYQGMTKNGLFNGKGRMTHTNGDIYQGQWLNGKANGHGVFVDTNGSMYIGQWKDDQQHGEGVESWNYNKIKFTGQFLEGKKTGKGKFEFVGGFYEGDFVDGQFHGIGKYYFSETGKVYEGEFRNNNMEGKGVMTWPDQSKYEGEFKNGKIEGKGTKTFSNGDRYIGQWKNDLQHGSGVYFSVKDQTKRQGEWQNGKRYSWIASPQSTYVTAKGKTSTQNSPSPTNKNSKIGFIAKN